MKQRMLLPVQAVQPDARGSSVHNDNINGTTANTTATVPQQKRRGRRPKSVSGLEAAAWDSNMIEILLEQKARFQHEFFDPKSRKALHGGWQRVLTAFNQLANVNLSVEQIKSKYQYLQKQWKVCQDQIDPATGLPNVPTHKLPLSYDALVRHFGSEMTNQEPQVSSRREMQRPILLPKLGATASPTATQAITNDNNKRMIAPDVGPAKKQKATPTPLPSVPGSPHIIMGTNGGVETVSEELVDKTDFDRRKADLEHQRLLFELQTAKDNALVARMLARKKLMDIGVSMDEINMLLPIATN